MLLMYPILMDRDVGYGSKPYERIWGETKQKSSVAYK